MSVAEHKPDGQRELRTVLWGFAWLSLVGALAGALLDRNSDLITQYFMAVQDATVAGAPARVFRISFTGELSYEINVPAWYGLAVWEAVMAAGEPYGITPYGTETMHVLRAEKGYPIVGQDTDGTVTPQDAGMEWIVSKAKDFIGKRSYSREDAVRISLVLRSQRSWLGRHRGNPLTGSTHLGEPRLRCADNRRHQAHYKVRNRIHQTIDKVLVSAAGYLARQTSQPGRAVHASIDNLRVEVVNPAR